MERRIGEVFEFNGVKLKTVRDDLQIPCLVCYFHKVRGFCHEMNCIKSERTDNESVIFKEIKE